MKNQWRWLWRLTFLFWLLCWFLIFSITQQWWVRSLIGDTISVKEPVRQLSWDVDFDDVNKKFTEIYNLLDSDYYKKEKIDLKTMKKGSIKSFVEAIGDPYTSYFDNEQNSEFIADLQGERDFEWIGAVVVKKDEGVMIEQVLKWSPAASAWLKPLDVIIKVDELSVADETLQESVNRIRGPEWSQVLLIVLRKSRDGSEASLLEVEVTRAALKQPSVISSVEKVWSKDVGKMTIALIGEQTDTLFIQEIRKLLDENIEWLILDLRWNWWWFLEEAVRISSWFIPKGELVVRAEYPHFADDVFRSKWPAVLSTLPVVVLVDELTASAWEIIALALREKIGARIVWTQTFGKWSIQTLHEFSDDTWLKFTVWQRFSPNDTLIDEVWITPDVIVDFDEDIYLDEYRDTQSESAERVLLELIEQS